MTQNRTVLFRTAEGELFTTVMNEKPLFEADDHTADEGWSVILRGTARMLSGAEEIREAEQAGLMPWVPTEKRASCGSRRLRSAPGTSGSGRSRSTAACRARGLAPTRLDQYGTAPGIGAGASAAAHQPSTVSTTTTTQCRGSWWAPAWAPAECPGNAAAGSVR